MILRDQISQFKAQKMAIGKYKPIYNDYWHSKIVIF